MKVIRGIVYKEGGNAPSFGMDQMGELYILMGRIAARVKECLIEGDHCWYDEETPCVVVLGSRGYLGFLCMTDEGWKEVVK